MPTIDLRSDTVTQPTEGMREAMMSAELGDDVFGDDPTVLALQDRAAELFGKEAALFVPSGTMGNQVCIRSHTEPGDEIVASGVSHIYLYEGGGYAALAGVSINCLQAERGLLQPEQIEASIRGPGSLSHCPYTKLVCLENTANRGGGAVYSMDSIHAIADVVREHELKYHLDGARVFNASVASGVPVAEIASPFDSLTFCLSKGLGCPVGSVVVGSGAFIDRCHRFRKMLGGGMRQAGILAGAGLYALENHVDRLADDHRRARTLGELLGVTEGFSIDMSSIETNMVYVDVSASGLSSAEVVDGLANEGVAVTAVDTTSIRAVTHLQITDEDIQLTAGAFAKVSSMA